MKFYGKKTDLKRDKVLYKHKQEDKDKRVEKVKALVLGGVRSGKSGFAENWAENHAKQNQQQVHYIATAEAGDGEMKVRIEKHRQDRENDTNKTTWTTDEEPLFLANAIAKYKSQDDLLIIDCLTLWLSNLLCHKDPTLLEEEKKNLFSQLEQTQASVVMVSNEVGLGIMPMGELTRKFGDEAGWLHQQLAKECDEVYLTVAGIATQLK